VVRLTSRFHLDTVLDQHFYGSLLLSSALCLRTQLSVLLLDFDFVCVVTVITGHLRATCFF